MKGILIFLFGLVAITFVSANVSNEKARQSTAVQMQRLKSKVLFLPLRENQNEKIERIMHLMHLMELACLKKFAKPVNLENRIGRPRPFKPLRKPAIKSDGSSLDDRMPFLYPGYRNHSPPQNGKYFGNSRVIFVPPLKKRTEKHANFSRESKEKYFPTLNYRNAFSGEIPKEKRDPEEEIHFQNNKNINISEKQNFARNSETPQSNFRRNSSNQKQKEKKETEDSKIKYIKILPPNDGATKEKQTMERLKVFEKNPEISKAYFEKLEQPIFPEMKSTMGTNFENSSRHIFNHSIPNKIHQYEVEELIEERVSIDLKDDQFQRLPFSGKSSVEAVQQNNETDINDLISKSINSVLKNLISPIAEMTPTTEKIKEAFTKEEFFFNNSLTSHSPRLLKPFSNHQSENFLKKINKNQLPSNRERPIKPLKITFSGEEEFHDWSDKTTTSYSEFTTEPQSNVTKFNSTPATTIEYENNIYTTDAELTSNYPQYSTQARKNPLENFRQKTLAVPEIKTTDRNLLDSAELLGNSDQLENQGSSSFSETEKSFSQSAFTTNDEYSPTFSITSEIPFTENKKWLAIDSITTNKPETTEIHQQEITSTLMERNLLKNFSKMNLNEMEQTNFDYQGLTSLPMTFDLLEAAKANLKKDKEAAVRKINFEQDLTKNAAVGQISEVENEEQRRSDILITENFSDYDDLNNSLSLSSFLKKVNQVDSLSSADLPLNLTVDSIIPLIPIVITDLREGKISPKDLSSLSKAFGKYWTTVMAMANSTNLDMLPLLKMKKEEDFKNILQNFYEENTEVTTTTTTTTKSLEIKKDNNYELYDYLEEYKDFYEDVLESESEKNDKKRKKYRLKRDEENELRKMEATAELFESIEVKKSQENNFIHEDIVYGEILEDEYANILELRLKTADVNININNETSKARNKIL